MREVQKVTPNPSSKAITPGAQPAHKIPKSQQYFEVPLTAWRHNNDIETTPHVQCIWMIEDCMYMYTLWYLCLHVCAELHGIPIHVTKPMLCSRQAHPHMD